MTTPTPAATATTATAAVSANAPWESLNQRVDVDGRHADLWKDPITEIVYALPADRNITRQTILEDQALWVRLPPNDAIQWAECSLYQPHLKDIPYFRFGVEPAIALLTRLALYLCRDDTIPAYSYRYEGDNQWVVPLRDAEFRQRFSKVALNAETNLIRPHPDGHGNEHRMEVFELYTDPNQSGTKATKESLLAWKRLEATWEEVRNIWKITSDSSNDQIEFYSRFKSLELKPDCRGAEWITLNGIPKTAGGTENIAEQFLRVFFDDFVWLIGTPTLPDFDEPIDLFRYRQFERKYKEISEAQHKLVRDYKPVTGDTMTKPAEEVLSEFRKYKIFAEIVRKHIVNDLCENILEYASQRPHGPGGLSNLGASAIESRKEKHRVFVESRRGADQ